MTDEQVPEEAQSLPNLDALAEGIAGEMLGDGIAAPVPEHSIQEPVEAPEVRVSDDNQTATESSSAPAPSSESVRIGDRDYTREELEVLAASQINRDTYNQQMQQQRDELERAYNWVQQQRQEIEATRQQISQQQQQNDVYRQYLTRQGAEMGDPVSDFVSQGQSDPQRPQGDYMTRQEADQYINQRLNQGLDQRFQQQREAEVKGAVPNWINEAVQGDPTLKARESQSRDALFTRTSRYFDENRIDPFRLSNQQLQGVIREQALRLAQEEQAYRTSLTSQQGAAQQEAVKDLPPVSPTIGTETPRKPSALTFNVEDSWQKSGRNSDQTIDEMFAELERGNAELDRAANTFGIRPNS